MNPLKAKLAAGETVAGVLVSLPSVAVVQTLAAAGADWIMIDMEHGPIGIEAAHAMIAATAGTDCVPVVRAPGHQQWMPKQVLDAGAFGIIFPMICTRAQAEATVRAVRYPPLGERGFGPFYAPARWGLSLADYIACANDEILNIVLIEHIDAVEAADEILAVPGIDVASIAPFDLSGSLGLTGQRDHPDVRAAIERAEERILANGVVLGGLADSVEAIGRMKARGYRALILGADIGLIGAGAAPLLEAVRR